VAAPVPVATWGHRAGAGGEVKLPAPGLGGRVATVAGSRRID